PALGPEVYQPWIHALDDGRIACAGHFGADDPIGKQDQHISRHLFRLRVNRRTQDARLDVVRDFDEAADRWPNAYTLRLTREGQPLADKEIEFWYVERDAPGYD